MNIPPDVLPPELMGKRLRIARETARLRQQDAASQIGLSRTTLVAIEKGDRAVKGSELRALVDLYGISMNQLLRKDSVHVDLVPRFRRLPEVGDPGVDDAAQVLNELVSAEVELEDVLGVVHSSHLPPERHLSVGDVRQQAESDALELRNWLGLGVRPVADIKSLLELELGVRVYEYPLHAKVSGLFAYDDEIGACILINALHPPERQAQSLAHELGHIVSSRRKPEVLAEEQSHNSREERYATVFGRVFLMPTRAVIQKFREITAGATKLTRRHVIILAHFFGVSREAAVRRLEELGLAREGSWDWFAEKGRITDAQVTAVLGMQQPKRPVGFGGGARVSLKLGTMAAEAMSRGILSEGQISQLLKIDRVVARSLHDEIEDGDDELHELH